MYDFGDALYLIFFSSGVTVGFGHCIGMCGPIVVSFSLSLKDRRVLLPHLLYNAGRIITYALLGGLMGATGSFTLVAAHIAGIQKGALIFAGILVFIMGLAMGGFFPMGRVFGDYCNPHGIISRGFRKLTAEKPSTAYFPVGLLLGLLPCGPVYTALIAAAGAGVEAKSTVEAVLRGMGLMLCFGIGTMPALLTVGKLAGMGWLRSRRIIYRVGALLMMLAGAYFFVKGILW